MARIIAGERSLQQDLNSSKLLQAAKTDESQTCPETLTEKAPSPHFEKFVERLSRLPS